MDIATRQERKDILRQIDKLENGRCEKCTVYTHLSTMHCDCTVAVEIRALGKKLIATTTRTRQKRIDVYVQDAKANGLTPEIYRALREHDLPLKKICKLIGWTPSKLEDWRETYKQAYNEPKVEIAVEEKPREKGKIAERAGLTLDIYNNAKKIGYFDRDICNEYRISSEAMLDFKKRNGLSIPRGHNSKYAHTNKREKVQV